MRVFCIKIVVTIRHILFTIHTIIGTPVRCIERVATMSVWFSFNLPFFGRCIHVTEHMLPSMLHTHMKRLTLVRCSLLCSVESMFMKHSPLHQMQRVSKSEYRKKNECVKHGINTVFSMIRRVTSSSCNFTLYICYVDRVRYNVFHRVSCDILLRVKIWQW